MKDYKYLEAKNAIQRLAIASEIWRDVRNEIEMVQVDGTFVDINALTEDELERMTRP